MSRFLQEAREGAVLYLTMSRPQQHNALSDAGQFDEFEEVCRRVNTDESIRVVVLTGEGSSFCAGGNVKDMVARSGLFAGAPYELTNNYRRGIQRIPTALFDLEVPSIAAVNGHAIGAGCDLACMCDIRIASERASFAESFAKLGIVPGDGGAWLLPRVVGMSKACEMAFTADTVSAAEALRIGLVSRVVPPAELMDEARRLATRIAGNPAHALRLGKRLLRMGQSMSLEQLLEVSASFQALSHHTEAHREIVEKFR